MLYILSAVLIVTISCTSTRSSAEARWVSSGTGTEAPADSGGSSGYQPSIKTLTTRLTKVEHERRRDPRSLPLRLEEAKLLGLSGRETDALDRWQAILSEYPGLVDVYVDRAEHWIRSGRYGRAQADLASAAHLDLNYTELFRVRGLLLYQERNYEEAARQLEAYLIKNPASAEARYYLQQCKPFLNQ